MPSVGEPGGSIDGETARLIRILLCEEQDSWSEPRDAIPDELTWKGGEAATNAVITALASDTCWLVRQASATALGYIKSDAVVPALAKALGVDVDETVRLTIVKTLAEYKADAAGAVPALVEAATADVSRQVRRSAIKHLGDIAATAAVPALCGILALPCECVKRYCVCSELRTAAMLAVAQIGDRSSVPTLCELLARPGEKNSWYRREAAALKKIADPSAVSALTQALARETCAETRKEAAEALGRIGLEARPAIPTLVEALAADDENVRHEAAKSLATITELNKKAGGGVKAAAPDHWQGRDPEHRTLHVVDAEGIQFTTEPRDTFEKLSRWLGLGEVLLGWPNDESPSQVAIAEEAARRGMPIKRGTVRSYINQIEDRMGGVPILVAVQESGRASEFADGAKARLAVVRNALSARVRSLEGK